MNIHGTNKLALSAGQTMTVKVYHADGYYKDVHDVEVDEDNDIVKITVM